MKTYQQQGDVLVESVDEIPSGLKSVGLDSDGAAVFARGETTGHRHAIYDAKGIEMFDAGNGMFFVRVSKTSELKHEEHKTITLEPGIYKVRGVQEYDHFSEEAKRVQD
jgi:hypothetical protein